MRSYLVIITAALALARLESTEQFYACLEELTQYDERVAKRAEQYLRGFKLQLRIPRDREHGFHGKVNSKSTAT